jgi:uncharacterized protein YuzE
MAVYTYDAEADVLQVLLVDEAETIIQRTVELGSTLHVDLDPNGRVVGVEFLYPRTHGMDSEPLMERFGIDLKIPFSFAA